MHKRWLNRLAGAAAVGLVAAATSQAAAFAERGGTDQGSPAQTATQGATITVTVTGTGVRGGSAGRTATRTVSTPAPCWMEPGLTGRQYYEYVTGTGAYQGHGMEWQNRHMGEQMTPMPGYEQYKDDDAGRWWGGRCTSAAFAGSLTEFLAFANGFFADHPLTFVPAGAPVPVAPVPPEVLRDVAMRELTLPQPVLDWNPKRLPDSSTVVSPVDTWVWLTDRRQSLYVLATATTVAGTVSARVDTALTRLSISAPDSSGAQCAGPGVPYARGATGECSVEFTRSSAHLPGGVTPVTATTSWHATWSANGSARGDVPVQPSGQSHVTPIAVAEVPTVVR